MAVQSEMGDSASDERVCQTDVTGTKPISEVCTTSIHINS